ncbi:GRIP1-associated protein 1-like [Amphibalanus amphitrite]|uniref:GRIP1-associated protein 1-like n=1 Tax=Amphibalanus amphitrite TaxID=1232801 RepID=UPI001C9191D0|nr:GRIP1-associated protein 1-like [Amphibalanus amphitrite]XP_043230341.1 GRIP1-associated protein 1-like [Amphibalanus amphitrite]
MSQGISEEEFTQLQNQFLELKTTNYALEDRNRKQEAALSELQARLQRSAAETARLQQVVDKSKKARELELLMQANTNLEKKLLSQEDDFRLQNQTLLQELSVYVSANEKLEQELKALQAGKPELLETQYAEEALRLRAESEALREELGSCRRQTETQLTELRDKVTALTQVNTQLERAARPEDANPVATEDAEYVEVGSGEVCYKKAAGGAHELLEAAEHKIQELQSDIEQYADMRLSLDTTRRELELARTELRRLRETGGASSSSGGGGGVEAEQLRQKLAKKHDSYLSLQAEMEALRQSKQSEIDDLKQQLQKETEEAKAKMQRYQTQLNNGYAVLKAEREKAAATITGLTERLAKYESVDSPDDGTSGGTADSTTAPSSTIDPTETVRLAAQITDLTSRLEETRRTAAAAQETSAAQLRETEKRLQETQTRLQEIQTRLQETEAALGDAQTRLEARTAELAESQRRLAETDERRTETEARLQETEARRAETETERDDALKLAQKRKSVLDEMAIHIQQLTVEHSEALGAAEEARRQVQALADSTATELQETRDKLSRVEAELGRVQESLEAERRQRQEQEQRAADQERELTARLQQEQQERDQERQQLRQEKEAAEQAHAETVKDLNTQLEISSAQLSEFKEKVATLRQEVKDSVDEKRIHERKGASITKDLRRQLAQERRRADRLQQALQDTSFADKSAELSPPPESDAQSVSSWSLMSGENGGAAPPSVNGSGDSPVDTETVSLLARITRLQEEKWRVEEKLNHLEQSSGALADDLANKAALIQFYCMEGRQPTGAVHSPEGRQRTGGAESLTPVKKLVDFVKHLSLDEQQREMQRRMQRMLEETLTKNMHLQKDLQIMSKELEAARRQATQS